MFGAFLLATGVIALSATGLAMTVVPPAITAQEASEKIDYWQPMVGAAAVAKMAGSARPFQEATEEDGGLFSWATIATVSLGFGFGYAMGCNHFWDSFGDDDEAIGVPCPAEATLVGAGMFVTMTAVKLLTTDSGDSEVEPMAVVLGPSVLPGAIEIGFRLPIRPQPFDGSEQ